MWLQYLTICVLFLNIVAENREKLPPNIIIFLVDDLGFGDLPTFGHPSSKTPNLDKLYRVSKVFNNFYSASPVCSPSRFVIFFLSYIFVKSHVEHITV